MAMPEETALSPAEALARQVEVMRTFLSEHPELASQLGVEVKPDAGPPVPLTIAHIVGELVDHIPGIDLERREQMRAAIDAHFAPEPEPEAAPKVIPGQVEPQAPFQQEAPAPAPRQALPAQTTPPAGPVA